MFSALISSKGFSLWLTHCWMRGTWTLHWIAFNMFYVLIWFRWWLCGSGFWLVQAVFVLRHLDHWLIAFLQRLCIMFVGSFHCLRLDLVLFVYLCMLCFLFSAYFAFNFILVPLWIGRHTCKIYSYTVPCKFTSLVR